MIEHLAWDSDFFGLKAGRVSLSENKSVAAGDYDLLYLFAAPGDRKANERALELGAVLVDEKVTYLLDLEGDDYSSAGISSYRSSETHDEAVIRIGTQSGHHSRFFVDPNIEKRHFEQLYRMWMERSIGRQMASEVFVHFSDGQPDGVLTFGEKGGRADIGILAVDAFTRGKGIGKALVEAAKHHAKSSGFAQLQVVTQKANKTACRFYERCGFAEDTVMNVYHYWKKQQQ